MDKDNGCKDNISYLKKLKQKFASTCYFLKSYLHQISLTDGLSVTPMISQKVVAVTVVPSSVGMVGHCMNANLSPAATITNAKGSAKVSIT